MGVLTTHPGDGHPDPITDTLELHFDPLDEEPDDLLAVGRCGRRGVSLRGVVTGRFADLFQLVTGERGRLRLAEAGVFFFEPLDFLQRLFPPPLQRPLHEPVLRFGCLILPMASVNRHEVAENTGSSGDARSAHTDPFAHAPCRVPGLPGRDRRPFPPLPEVAPSTG